MPFNAHVHRLQIKYPRSPRKLKLWRHGMTLALAIRISGELVTEEIAQAAPRNIDFTEYFTLFLKNPVFAVFRRRRTALSFSACGPLTARVLWTFWMIDRGVA